jgi:hypothetical protein
MAMQPLTFAQFARIAPHVVRSRKPIMGHGRHGIGKSEVVYQLADKLTPLMNEGFTDTWGDNYVFPVIERRVSQMPDTGDIVGVPEVAEKSDLGRVTNMASMEWFATACNQPCILFFDEADRGSQDVRQAIMELTDSRKIAGKTLHPDTIVIAMVNGGAHDTGNVYQVNDMDAAELDRWWHVDLEPSVEDWTSWASDAGINPVVVDFIKAQPRFLEQKEAVGPHDVTPSRRSWVHFNKCLASAAEAGTDYLTPVEGVCPLDLVFLGRGFVGESAVTAFRDFAGKYNNRVSVQDVLDNTNPDGTANWGIGDFVDMNERLSVWAEIESISEEQNQNLATFVAAQPLEAVAKFWGQMGSAHPTVMGRLWKLGVTVQGKDRCFGDIVTEACGSTEPGKTE